MKTIIYVGNFEMPDKNAAAHRVINNGKAFKELGYKVVYIGVDKTLEKGTDILCTEKEYDDFITYAVTYPKSRQDWMKFLFDIESFKRVYQLYSEDVSCVICYNYPAALLAKMLFLSRKNYFKVIADCTEWYDGGSNGFVFKVIKGLDSFFRMRVLQKKMDGLILISTYLMNYYSSFNKKVFIPPLIDMEDEKWKVLPADLPADKINLVYAGSPGKNKDRLDLVIKAVVEYELKNINLHIIGVTLEEYLFLYPELAVSSVIFDERIHFLGRKSHAECISYLKSADYTLILRNKNIVTEAGFPTKFVEAVTLNVPVIATDVGDVKNYRDIAEIIILPGNYTFEDISGMLCSLNKKRPCFEILNSAFDYHTKIYDMADVL